MLSRNDSYRNLDSHPESAADFLKITVDAKIRVDLAFSASCLVVNIGKYTNDMDNKQLASRIHIRRWRELCFSIKMKKIVLLSVQTALVTR